MPVKPKKSTNDTRSVQRQKQLGKNISTMRKKAGFKNSIAFAVDKDLNTSIIGSWEAGKGNPTFLNLCKVADALGVSLSELVKGIE